MTIQADRHFSHTADYVASLSKRKLSKIPGYLLHIRFPYFRNIEDDTKIEFSFPLTVLIGKNGCGKSSVLQAVYACPKDKSLRDFWFSTFIDPINEEQGHDKKHRFIYGYLQNKTIVECIKTRAGSGSADRKGPDYWETDRPRKRDKVKSNLRIPPLKKQVVYVDFRHQMSAFDVCFHVNGKPHSAKSQATKQDYIRSKSAVIRKVIDKVGAHPKVSKNWEMNHEELAAISFILGREYVKGRIIEHRLYSAYAEKGMSHSTVILDNGFASYSEAGAGSGETSVALLVHGIFKAAKDALILLDEPETALHPGAQARLQRFLLHMCKEHGHQIIISTHSPEFARGLPNKALKVFRTTPEGKFTVVEDVDANSAFIESEVPLDKTTLIRVEDKMASRILTKVLERMGSPYVDLVEVFYEQGGSSFMWDESIYLARQPPVRPKRFLLFDNDQNRVTQELKVLLWKNRPLNLEELKTVVNEYTGLKEFKFALNTGSTDDGKRLALSTYLDFAEKHIFFLPCMIPEDIIWSKKALELMAVNVGKPENAVRKTLDDLEANSKLDSKAKIYGFVQKIFPTDVGNKFEYALDWLLETWSNMDTPPGYSEIRKIILAVYETSQLGSNRSHNG